MFSDLPGRQREENTSRFRRTYINAAPQKIHPQRAYTVSILRLWYIGFVHLYSPELSKQMLLIVFIVHCCGPPRVLSMKTAAVSLCAGTTGYLHKRHCFKYLHASEQERHPCFAQSLWPPCIPNSILTVVAYNANIGLSGCPSFDTSIQKGTYVTT
jgi:hypothetical protein